MSVIGPIRYLTVGNSTYEIYNTDTKLTQTTATASGYTYWRPLVIGYSSASTEGTAPTTQTNTTYTFSTLMVQPSSGTIRFGKASLYNGDYTVSLVADTLTTNRSILIPDANGTLALTTNIPTKVSDLDNDSGFTTNTGTVTSITLKKGTGINLDVDNTAITTSGTRTISLATAYGDSQNPYGSKTKNYVLAAPSNAAGAPSFRALVSDDIPDLSSIYLTSFTETDPTVPSWAKASSKPSYTASEVGAVATTAVGAASGVAPLNASQKIDSIYLPSYVDDVIEGYYYNNKFWSDSSHTTEITGEAGKIYVDLSTNKTYRYSGSAFVEVSSGSLVTITRNLTSGTKSATINVDGTDYDIYSTTPPSAATTAPVVDGTAAVGSSSKYAKEDHVHPTDTSRAASTAVTTQATINNTGLITYKNSSDTSLYTVQLPLFDGGSGPSDLPFLPLAGGSLTGNLSVGGTTTSTGLLTANGGISTTTLTTSGNTTVGGTLGVTGATTLGNTLGVTGATTLNSTLNVTGATTLDSKLKVNGATTVGDVTVNGSLDITPRRCSASLSSAGWYRAVIYNAYDTYSAQGSSGEIVDIDIVWTATNNCGHRIRLFLDYGKVTFLGEESNGTYNIVDKIRYTYSGSFGYIDIHFVGVSSGTVPVHFAFDVTTRTYANSYWVAGTLASVADAPSGETVVTEYSFGTNGVYTNTNLTVNGTFDVVPRRCSATLSSAGWYRVMTTIDAGGTVFEFTIGRPYGSGAAQAHKIDFFMVGGGKSAFMNEASDANNLYIDKIRCTYGGGYTHFDVHYNTSATNNVYVDFNVQGNHTMVVASVSENLVSVADAPAGETVLTTYEFSESASVLKTYVDATTANYTVASNHYVAVDYPSGINPKNCVAIGMYSFSSVSGPITLIPYGQTANDTKWYIIGDAGVTLTGVKFRYWYV